MIITSLLIIFFYLMKNPERNKIADINVISILSYYDFLERWQLGSSNGACYKHGPMLQVFVFVFWPMQWPFPIHSRIRDFIPSPHDVVHMLHAPHWLNFAGGPVLNLKPDDLFSQESSSIPLWSAYDEAIQSTSAGQIVMAQVWI